MRTRNASRRALGMTTVVALGVLGMTACSGGSTNEETGGASTGDAADPVTLEFWDMQWGPADTYPAAAQNLVDQFNSENPGIQVNYTSKSWDNWYQTFAQAVGGDAAPDVSTGGSFQPFGLQADADAILPLNDLITKWQSDGTADDFKPGMLDVFKDANGDVLAVPWTTDIRSWFYRTDVLEEAGVPVPTTWDEFAAACSAVHEALPGVYGVADGGTPHWTFMQGSAFGAGLFDTNGDAAITAPKELEALKFIASMGQGGSGCINPTATTISDQEAIAMFDQGKAAFVMDSPSTAVNLSADSLEYVKVLPPLENADGGKFGLHFINGVMGYKQTEHPEEVMTFISWWSEHGKGLFLGGASGVSPRISIDSDPAFDATPLYREAAELWGAPVAQPLYVQAPTGFAALNTIDGDTTMLDLERALFSGADVDQAAAAAQTKVQGFVDDDGS